MEDLFPISFTNILKTVKQPVDKPEATNKLKYY